MSILVKFEAKILKTDSCWIWQAAKRGKSGYGCMKVNKKVVDAHRISYSLYNGEIPEKLLVCHTCDNRLCVNPKHLFLGTHKDNMADCAKKGRYNNKYINCKRPNPRRKLSNQQIDEIKNLLSNGLSMRKIAILYKINLCTIFNIKHGKFYVFPLETK